VGTSSTVILAAYDGDALLDWSWVQDHTTEIWQAVREHMELVGWSLLWGVVLAVPLAVLAHRHRFFRGPALSVVGILYTIPSLAAFALLLPYTGLDQSTAIIPLTTYTLLILVRNVLAGLDGIEPDVREAAVGMGYSSFGTLTRVELPLAVPAILAGVRIAAVTLIGLVPVAAIVGQGGLGTFMLDGLNRAFQTPLTVGIVLVLLLAVGVDFLLVLLQRLVAPWDRAGRRG
jgi:osmoprotectant transport system permease protein